jgi:hypothetical protein
VETNLLSNFAKFAPHLANPFVLIGFVLFLLFSVHQALIKSKILPPVDRKTSGIIILAFLRYGFWIGVLLIVFGVGYAAWKTYRETKSVTTITTTVVTGDVNFYRSADYQALQAELEKAQQHVKSYPDDPNFRQELKETLQKIEDFKRDVLKLADDFNKIPINTERLRLAKQYFGAGDYKAARAILDAESIGRDQDTHC